MFPTLFAKTFAILISQLLVTFLGTLGFRKLLGSLQERNVDGLSRAPRPQGRPGLLIDNRTVQPYVWPILLAYFVLFFLLITVGIAAPAAGIVIFSLWSLVMGAFLTLALARFSDEFVARVVALTALVTILCGLIGTYSNLVGSRLESILFWALLALLAAYTLRLFLKLTEEGERLIAFFGVIVFVGYLLVDFNRIAYEEKKGENNWSVAMDIAINIYLDIINLLLQLLELLAESSD